MRSSARGALVDEHVGTRGHETLVLHHPPAAFARRDLRGVGHGLRGIADVLVEGAEKRRRRRPERGDAPGVEIEAPAGGAARRPLSAPPPAVSSGLEREDLREVHRGTVLQVPPEEGELHLLPEVLPRLRAVADRPVGVSRQSRPSPVVPRTDDEVRVVSRAPLLEAVEQVEGTREVLGVVPAPDDEHGVLHSGHVLRDVPRLPVRVVRPVRHELVPRGNVVAEERLRVRGGPEGQEKTVSVRGAVVEGFLRHVRGRGPPAGVVRHPVEGIGELEGAARMVVVAEELVLGRSLRGGETDRGMGVEHAERRLPARPGDAALRDAPVVVGHVGEQPQGGVVHVRARVRLRGPPHEGLVVDELAFRPPATAHVLVDEDEAFLAEVQVGSRPGPVAVGAIGPDAVGVARHEERIRLRGVARGVDRGEETHPVAHRDHHLALFVVLLQHVGRRRGRG